VAAIVVTGLVEVARDVVTDKVEVAETFVVGIMVETDALVVTAWVGMAVDLLVVTTSVLALGTVVGFAVVVGIF
jgi:hypothetical protein